MNEKFEIFSSFNIIGRRIGTEAKYGK